MKTKTINTHQFPVMLIYCYFCSSSYLNLFYLYFVIHTKTMNTNSCFGNNVEQWATAHLCSSFSDIMLVSWNQPWWELCTPWKLAHATIQCFFLQGAVYQPTGRISMDETITSAYETQPRLSAVISASLLNF